MAVDGLTDDFITTPDGVRVPAKLVSPDVAARAKGFTYDDAVNLGKNIVTTGKETSEEITDLFTKPWETTVGRAAIASQLGAAAPMVKFGQDIGAIPKPTPVATAKDMQPQLPAPGSPPGGSPSSLPGMVGQAAMGASLPVGETSLKARVGGAPMGSYADERKELDTARKMGMSAEDKLAEAQSEAAKAVAAEHEGKARFLEQEAIREQEIQKQTQVERDRRLAEIDALTNDLNKLSPNIDPKAYWANKNNAEKVTMAIGIFLGGLGGGPNKALGMLDNAIAQDIDAQQQRFENAKGLKLAEIEAKKNVYGMFRQGGLDDASARAATRGLFLQRLDAQLEGTKSKYSSPEILARADQMKAKLQNDYAKSRVELQQLQNNDARANAILQLQQRQFQAQQQAARAEAASKSGVGNDLIVPGVGVALTSDDAKKMKEKAAAVNAVDKALEDLIALREQEGWTPFGRDANAKAEAQVSNLMLRIKDAANTGAIDAGMIETVQGMIPKDPLQFSDSAFARLKQARQSLRDGFAQQARAHMDPRYATQPQTQQPTTIRKKGG